MNNSTLFLSDALPIDLQFVGCKGYRYSFPIGTNCKIVRKHPDHIMVYFDKKDVVKYEPWGGSIHRLSGQRIGKNLDRNVDAKQFALLENYLTTTR